MPINADDIVPLNEEGAVGEVTLNMDEGTLARMRDAAKAAGMPMSEWLAQLVRERTRAEWPPAVAALAGAWRDLQTADELRATQPADIPREQV